jgi:hypothetical protein
MRSGCLLLCVLAACGGKLDDGDAGVDASSDGSNTDATLSKDTSLVDAIATGCSKLSGGTVADQNGCQVTETWTCGQTQYSIDCTCPNAKCTCSQQTSSGGSGTIIAAPSVCPGCSGGSLVQLCGFPPPAP